VVNAKENGRLAAEFFFKAECTIPNGAPFTWFFVRPPWAPSGVCCKSCVFNSMVEICSDPGVSSLTDDNLAVENFTCHNKM